MKLVVGFILYRGTSAKYLTDFLPSLRLALDFLPADDYRVYAFDNSPKSDNSNETIITEFNQRNPKLETIRYLRTETGFNQGFGRPYNRLIKQAAEDCAVYFLMINPDTILEPIAISELIKAFEAEKERGSFGAQKLAVAVPKIRRWDFPSRRKTEIIDSCGLIKKSGLRFKDLGQGDADCGQFDRNSTWPILSSSGAAGLFRISALEKIKEQGQYFDERFFMYREDCDLALRLNQAGFTARLVSSAVVYHDRTAASSGRGFGRALKDRFRKSRQIRSWSHLSELLIYVKHWKSQNFWSKTIIIVRALAIFIFSLILEQFNLKNYRRAWRMLKDVKGID